VLIEANAFPTAQEETQLMNKQKQKINEAAPRRGAYIASQMRRRCGEFRQLLTVMEHVCGVSGVSRLPLMFCCAHFWHCQKWIRAWSVH